MAVDVPKPGSVGLASICALAGALLFISSPALAAAPEAPNTEAVTAITATTATFHGILNPGATAPGEAGHYEFLYKASATECQGASKAPEPPGTALGFEHEEVPAQEVTGLTAHTEYTVCLVERNLQGEETVGSAVTFKTALPPEIPTTQPASPISDGSETLHGMLNPNAPGDPGTYEFRYRASASECKGEGERRAPTPPAAATGEQEEPASAEVTGLSANTQYTFCLLARNEAQESAVGAPVTFTTLALAPTIEAVSFSNVGSASAAVSASMNDYGVPGTYYYEYGTSLSYGSTTPATSLGAINGNVSAPASLGGLQPDTVYHFRAVATSEAGTTASPDVTFTTLTAGLLGLPDGRGYEMVTPVNNEDVNVYVTPTTTWAVGTGGAEFEDTSTSRPLQAAADGNAVAYAGDPNADGNQSQGASQGNQYVAVRSASGGWTQKNVQPRGIESARYWGFSSDLSVGVLESREPLSAGVAPEPYNVLYTDIPGEGGYRALFTSTPKHRNPNTLEWGAHGFGHLEYGGASSDFAHVLFEANDALTETAEERPPGEDELYDSVNGQLRLVSVLPNGEADPNAVFGASGPHSNSANTPDLSHVISADGSRVFWTDLSTGLVYVRENDAQPQSPLGGKGECVVPSDACTVAVSAGPAKYWTASANGRYAFYTEGVDLYRFDVASGERLALTSSGGVQSVAGASEDGEYVYFTATAALAGANGESKSPVVGQVNLYLRHAGATTFIAQTSPINGAEEAPGTEVTPDGHSMVFMSSQSLTGYENMGMIEVFVYDQGTGRLVCASCDRSGEAPPVNAGNGTAAYLPAHSPGVYQPRWISEDGSRVFFDSNEPLVAQDRNGKQDVYEWERDGAGSCRHSNGCVYLLSGGSSTDNSYLLDASANGNDVFIVTRAQLAPQDQNEFFDLYDARVGAVPPPVPPQCSGTGCQGLPGAPPIFATPSSVTFNGVGNFPPPASGSAVKSRARSLTNAQKLAKALRSCRALHNKHKRRVCEAGARRRYRSKAATVRKSDRGGV